MTYWLKIGGALVAVWIVAAVAVHLAHGAKPTAESITAYLSQANLNGSQRSRVISHVEDMYNGLAFDERQKVQREKNTREFFKALTPQEQGAFLDATLPAGFKQLMDSFNKMEPAQRKTIVDRALADMKTREGEPPPPGRDEKLEQHVVDQGLRSFYKDADANVKLDLAPLIEQMQKNLQSGGGGPGPGPGR